MKRVLAEPKRHALRALGAALLGALALLLLAPTPPFANAAGDGGEGARRLTLAGGEVTLTHPVGLALAVSAEQLLATSTIPACAEGFDYCFYLPAADTEGTNFSAAGLRVGRLEELRSEVSCLLAQPAGYQGLQPGVVRGERLSTSRFGGLGEGAAGSYSVGELHRLWTGSACYEFEARQVLTRYENYEPGAVNEFTATDQSELAALLRGVVLSVTVGERRPKWPLADSSRLEEFVRVAAPPAGEGVSSPLEVTGEAVGPWFFEGTFPLELISAAGESLATGYVTAESDWMTTGFVPFAGEVTFEVAEPTDAVLLLRRDNPSGLPEHDAAVRIPLLLLPE